MPDIIDAFVVTLGLDPSQYNREIKKYRDDRKRLNDEQAKQNREQEDAQKRAIGNFRTLRNEVAGFMLMLAGASGVKDFVQSIITGDAATGRLAKNLGLATEEVSAWEGAIKRVGGSAADIDGALRSMSAAFQSLQLTGTTGKDADFQGLGLNAKDLQNPSEALLKLAEASQRMSRPEFNARMTRLGFDQNTINLLSKGREEVSRLLEEQRRLGVATDKDAEAAQRLQDRLAKIESTIRGKLRPEIEKLAGAFADWLDKGDNLNNLLIVTGSVLGGLALAAAAAFWPFVLLAGAIAVVATNIDKLKAAWSSYSDWWENAKSKGDDFFDPIRKAMGLKTGAEARAGGTDVFGFGGGGSSGASGGGSVDTSGSFRDYRRAPLAGAGGRGGSSGGGSNAAQIEAFFKARGYTAAQARGITAGIIAESGGNPRAFNSAGGGNGAYGIGQWRGARLAALRRRYGANPSLQQQLEFLDWELKGGDPGGAGVRSATSAGGALSAYIGGPGWGFMRPDAAGRAGDMRRGMAFLNGRGGGGATTVSQTTTIGQITIYTPESTAPGIARDIRGELAKRGVVAQANTGLQP